MNESEVLITVNIAVVVISNNIHILDFYCAADSFTLFNKTIHKSN